MIKFLRSWCEGIIVAVIISIIIETILPEGNNKKYIKVVIGIYIIFTILTPILKVGADDSVRHEIETQTQIENETQIEVENQTATIQSVYANAIKQTMQNNIEEQFECNVEEINIEYDKNYENIEQITINIKNSNETNYDNLKKYISENYNVDIENIIIP